MNRTEYRPAAALLSEPMLIAENNLAGIDVMLIRRVAALFLKYRTQPAADGTDWTACSQWLVYRLIEEYNLRWLKPAVSECCAWNLAVSIARKHVIGFRTVAEVEADDSGDPGRYKRNPATVAFTCGAVQRAADLSVSQSDAVLENLSVIDPGLFLWANAAASDLPDELQNIAAMLWGTIPATDQRQRLIELAASLDPLRERLQRFQNRIGKAKHLKDHRKEANRRSRNTPEKFQHTLIAEGGYLSAKIDRWLIALPGNSAAIKDVGLICAVENLNEKRLTKGL